MGEIIPQLKETKSPTGWKNIRPGRRLFWSSPGHRERLAFINDLPECTSSETRLFADDGLLYKLIKSDKDAQSLQKDLNSLEKWEGDWQMSFHPEKCQVIHVCSNPRNRQRRQYTLHGHILESVDSAKYLGVHLSQDMTWQTHVNRTAAKASSTLGFLRRNLHSCTQDVRERTYNMFILPTLQIMPLLHGTPTYLGMLINSKKSRDAEPDT